MLHIPGFFPAKILVNADFGICRSIPIGVFTQPKMGRLSNQHFIIQCEDRPGQNQIIQISGRLIHAPVPIQIDQFHNPTDRFEFATHVDILHVAPHFGNIQLPVWSPSHANRLFDHGFRSNQFQFETIWHPKFGEGTLRRKSGG